MNGCLLPLRRPQDSEFRIQKFNGCVEFTVVRAMLGRRGVVRRGLVDRAGRRGGTGRALSRMGVPRRHRRAERTGCFDG